MAEYEDTREQVMKKLTLLLLYLASWEEEPIRGAVTVHCFWKKPPVRDPWHLGWRRSSSNNSSSEVGTDHRWGPRQSPYPAEEVSRVV